MLEFILRYHISNSIRYLVLVIIFSAPILSQGQDNKADLKSGIKDQVEVLLSEIEDNFSSDRSLSDSLMTLTWEIINRESINDSKILAPAFHLEGRILMRKGKFRESLNTFKESYKIKKISFPDSLKSISKTINNIGVCFFILSCYDSANYYYELAKEPLLKNNIWDINHYYAYLNIGINNASINKYKIAIEYFDSAYMVLEKGDMLKDSAVVGRYYYNLALNTTYTGKLEKANEYYKLSEDIYSDLLGPLAPPIANININKSVNSFYGYDFARAELYLKKALEVYKKNSFEQNNKIAQIYLILSQIYQERSKYKDAIDYILLGLETNPTNDLKLVLTNNLAYCYSHLDDWENANKYFKGALQLLNYESINPKRKQAIYSSYADFLLEKHDLTNSFYYYLKARSAAVELNGNNSKEYAGILVKIGDFYLNGQVPDSALLYFTNALRIFNSDSLSSQSDNLNVIERKRAKIGIGSALYQEYNQTGNIELLHSTDSIFYEVLAEMEIISSKLSTANKLLLLEVMYPVYIQAIEVSFEIYKNTDDSKYIERITNYIERSKSSALLAEVNSENAIKTSDIPIETFEFENQMKAEINGIRQMLGKEKIEEDPNTERIVFFETKLLELLNRYDSLIVEIENDYKKYYSVKYQNKVISLDEIMSNLDDDEIILEYMLADTSVYIMAITNNDFKVVKIKTDSNFYNSLNHIISIKNVSLSKQNLAKFNEFKYHSHELWKVLIEPQNDLIQSKSIIIIPDGILGYLPFDILLEYDFEAHNINYRDLPYLLINHPISYSYSSTLKFNTYFKAENAVNNSSITAFAPSYFNSSDSGQEKLENLEYAVPEVTEIIANHGGNTFLNDRATKESFNLHAKNSDIIHLSMHAIINDSLPLQSKLVFYNNSNDSVSNYMFTHEIYNMDLNAKMVTLSACNTGSGKFRKGEGIMSLARGFVYAGVPSIVMTLWEVQDATGSKLMNNYYNYLFEGQKKDKAMQNAKLSVLNDANMANAHPYFWSAYTVNGDTSTIDKRVTNNKTTDILVLILIAILSFVTYRFMKRKSKT